MDQEIPLLPFPARSQKKRRTFRQLTDQLAENGLLAFALLPAVILAVLALVLWQRARPILQAYPLFDLLAGTTWKPLQGSFGFLPFIAGTLWVTAAAMLLAVPPCLLTAFFLVEYAGAGLQRLVKPLLDLLAAIPSVVYGVWGVVVIVPWVQGTLAPFFDHWLGFLPFFRQSNPTGYGVLAGGLVLAVMVAPFIIAMTYEVLRAVPDGYRQAALALGATRWHALRTAVVPQVYSGILAGIVLGTSRALGETIAVLMVAGNVATLPHSIFDPVYPLPALIANNYGEMMSIPMYDSALLLAALILMGIVTLFNLLAQLFLRRIRRGVR
jgi:phosphate transport system permease protein